MSSKLLDGVDCLDYDCDCEKCKEKILIQRFRKSLESLKHLTKPETMAARDDPLLDAFELSKEIRKLKKMYLKKELKEFGRNCKIFTEGLCNECSDENEIAALYNIDVEQLRELTPEKSEKVVEILDKAVRANHREFVAHHHSQILLDTVVYSTIPMNFKKYHLALTLLCFAIYTSLFPICAIMFLFTPAKWKLSKWMKTPFIKFVNQVSQFAVFLALLVMAAFRNSHKPSVVEYLISIFVVAMIVQEILRMFSEKMYYFLKWWNCFTTVMLIIYLLSGVLWLVGFLIVNREKTGYVLLLVGNSGFSIASILSVFHFGNLCRVNSVFGPLQLSVYRMFEDILKFLTIFLGVFLAFTVGVRNLYSYNRSLQLEIRRQDNNTDNDFVITDHRLGTFWDAVHTMFWALFDQTDLEHFNTPGERFGITQETGKFLFGIFSICVVMVGINMLIAMMNNSYYHIAEDKDYLQWRFSRISLLLEYVGQKYYFCLPPPYNLLEIPFWIIHLLKKCCKCKHKAENIEYPTSSQLEEGKEEQEQGDKEKGQVQEQEEKKEEQEEEEEEEDKEKGQEKEQKQKELTRKEIVKRIAKRYSEKQAKRNELEAMQNWQNIGQRHTIRPGFKR